MVAFIRNRIIFSIPVIIGVSILVFLMLHALPGDPVEIMMGNSASADAAARVRHQLGLDRPLYIQYGRFVGHALTGDLGRSIRTNQPVMQLIMSQFPSTLQLTVAGLGFAIVLGMLLGTIAATHHRSWIDHSSMVVAVIGVSMPSFWLGFLFIAFFSLRLGWFPATGQGGLSRLVLPALALGIGASAVIARLVRSSMLEVMRQEYIGVARAKGLRNRAVVYRHGLRNALIPVVTIVGLQFGQLLAGTVIIETVFSRQGLGRLTIDAILNKDYPVVQGTILFTAVGYVLVNLLVDILYAFIDPQVRYD
ncbi:MAG TPA: nickel ABC transporter permease [Nitrolancea sp.]|nr:nickel ABC transporter permease [Nitrolancea sp.]